MSNQRSVLPLIECPCCKRVAFTRRDLVFSTLDGTARCRSCKQTVRLDTFSRWLLSCAIALILPVILLYGDVFYSGHLFVVSMVFIFSAWAALSWLCCPFLTLERAGDSPPLDRRTGMLVLVVLLAVGGIIDNFMASRFEPAEPIENARSTSAQGHR
jgi:hypothetical protein